MIGWFLVSGGLFWTAYCTKKDTTRQMGQMLLAAWMIFSVGMLILGGNPTITD
jgi:hypothetical protein